MTAAQHNPFNSPDSKREDIPKSFEAATEDAIILTLKLNLSLQ